MPPKLGILAGGGDLPGLIVQACREQGRDFLVVAFEGQAEKGAFDTVAHVWARLGAAGSTIEHLRAAGCKELVMAGSITRPSFAALRPDLWTARFFAGSDSQSLGVDGLMTALIRTLEKKEGFSIVAPDTLLPGLLAAKGVYGKTEPDRQAEEDIQTGIQAALDIGSQDIGQGAVVQQGHVLAVEDDKGTDALLKQARKLRLDGPGGVLVKVKKPGQERRVDLPTIGAATVEGAVRAGLRGIAFQAGGALVIDRDAVIEAADEAGIFVIGVEVESRPETLSGKDALRDTTSDTGHPLIFIVAGEPSGDALGARLMQALKKKTRNRVSFAGIGGDRMEEEGIKSLFPMADLSVMGAVEVLPRLPQLLGRIREAAEAIGRRRPAALVTIDSPDFNFRVLKRLGKKDFPFIHFVAPSVWAWRPGRAKKVAVLLDPLIALLPFEPPYFEVEGLKTTFVGHPVLESGADAGDGPGFRARHGFSGDDPIIAVLPGSRMGEVTRLGPVFAETLFLLKKKFPGLGAVVPTVSPVARTVRRLTAEWPVPALVLEGDPEKYNAFAAADIALAASGTVALELALAGTPAVITYKTNPLTALIGKVLFKARFVHIVNLVLDREAVPELLQGACRPDFLAAAVEDLLSDEDRRERQLASYAEALNQLGLGGPAPSERAATAVLDTIKASQKEK